MYMYIHVYTMYLQRRLTSNGSCKLCGGLHVRLHVRRVKVCQKIPDETREFFDKNRLLTK